MSFADAMRRTRHRKRNFVAYYKGNTRVVRRWSEVYDDIEATINRLYAVGGKAQKVAILGASTYEWMIIDLACLLGGHISIAIPDDVSAEELAEICEAEQPDLFLLQGTYYEVFFERLQAYKVFVFDAAAGNGPAFEEIPAGNAAPASEILETYGIAYTSGTSLHRKRLILSSAELASDDVSWWQRWLIALVKQFTFWGRHDNLLIIYLPFSHIQQRSFVKMAFVNGVNILISDPVNCLKHIITDKPNIMVSVPVVYRLMAQQLAKRLGKLKGWRRFGFEMFKTFQVNTLGNWNPIKRFWGRLVLGDIRKIYGGRADMFVVGSASLEQSYIQLFYSVGVKILEAYGQSETGIIAMNSPKEFRIGSVGKPQLDIVIADDSEILVKYEESSHEHNIGILNVGRDNYIHTGDLGFLDKDGYLFLLGRKDDVMVLPNGKKIFPVPLENQLGLNDWVEEAVLFNNGMPGLHAVLFCRKRTDDQVAQALIMDFNRHRKSYEQISFYYLEESKSANLDSFRTSNFKLKRKSVIEHYKASKFKTVA